MIDVGIVGVGTYLPEKTMKAAEIAGLLIYNRFVS